MAILEFQSDASNTIVKTCNKSQCNKSLRTRIRFYRFLQDTTFVCRLEASHKAKVAVLEFQSVTSNTTNKSTQESLINLSLRENQRRSNCVLFNILFDNRLEECHKSMVTILEFKVLHQMQHLKATSQRP